MALTRVMLTLDELLIEAASLESGRNLSQYVSGILADRLDILRRERLREELRAGHEAEADHDLEIARK